jgi:Protein of unknown function (DUF2804)
MQSAVRRHGRWRKRWIYVAAFAEELMVCAARVQVGPLGQTFWAVLDRRSGELQERTRVRLPGRRGEVWGDRGLVRIASPAARGELRIGAARAIEVTVPTAEGLAVWTRKAAGMPIEVDLDLGGRRIRLAGRGVTDETSGYHPRHTVWSWSAGVGALRDGRRVAWNLVEGVNDPPTGSERAIWLDGEPFEPGPVAFEGLAAIDFADGARLAFAAEAERRREENRLVVRSRYRQPFGRYAGSVPGGLELADGLGVMEHHDARW